MIVGKVDSKGLLRVHDGRSEKHPEGDDGKSHSHVGHPMRLEPFWREHPAPASNEGSSGQQHQETEADEGTMHNDKLLDPLVVGVCSLFNLGRGLSRHGARRGLDEVLR